MCPKLSKVNLSKLLGPKNNPKRNAAKMIKTGRRDFLKALGAGTLATLPITIGRALATPANDHTRSIEDIEHIVILMQENRSFDHVFATLSGVRGFSDARAVILPSGKSVWHQDKRAG